MFPDDRLDKKNSDVEGGLQRRRRSRRGKKLAAEGRHKNKVCVP